jgi:hypothetical protein
MFVNLKKFLFRPLFIQKGQWINTQKSEAKCICVHTHTCAYFTKKGIQFSVILKGIHDTTKVNNITVLKD